MYGHPSLPRLSQSIKVSLWLTYVQIGLPKKFNKPSLGKWFRMCIWCLALETIVLIARRIMRHRPPLPHAYLTSPAAHSGSPMQLMDDVCPGVAYIWASKLWVGMWWALLPARLSVCVWLLCYLWPAGASAVLGGQVSNWCDCSLSARPQRLALASPVNLCQWFGRAWHGADPTVFWGCWSSQTN